ncbi:MAG: hypothetical protein CM1200mP29_10520 [Verrucomicrobiota bacterium]|nr:MAG: hypothetical protein CM1200mP29_10520 [Verrucomicrobiota bacterium]
MVSDPEGHSSRVSSCHGPRVVREWSPITMDCSKRWRCIKGGPAKPYRRLAQTFKEALFQGPAMR